MPSSRLLIVLQVGGLHAVPALLSPGNVGRSLCHKTNHPSPGQRGRPPEAAPADYYHHPVPDATRPLRSAPDRCQPVPAYWYRSTPRPGLRITTRCQAPAPSGGHHPPGARRQPPEPSITPWPAHRPMPLPPPVQGATPPRRNHRTSTSRRAWTCGPAVNRYRYTPLATALPWSSRPSQATVYTPAPRWTESSVATRCPVRS